MTTEQLEQLVLDKAQQMVAGFEFDGLQSAVFEEVCENIVRSNNLDEMNEQSIILSTLTAFETCYAMMKGMIKGALDVADNVNINYRGVSFQFDKQSDYLK